MTDASDNPTNGAQDAVKPSEAPADATVLSSGPSLSASGRIGLTLLAAFFLIVNVAMFAGVQLNDLSAGLALGVIAAEITLCAVFAALAPVSVFARTAIGLAGAIVVCLAIFRMGGGGH